MFLDLTVLYIESIMSPALYASYQQWLDDNPGKADRLEGIVSQLLEEYRSAMTANASPIPSSDKAIHKSCLRHAQTTILFELKKEIGLTPSEAENASSIRADVFLRAIWMGSILITGSEDTSSPSYTPLSEPIKDP